MTLTESSRKGSSFAQFRQVYCWQLKKSRVLALVYGALALLGGVHTAFAARGRGPILSNTYL